MSKNSLFILLLLVCSSIAASINDSGSKTCSSTCDSEVCKSLSKKLLENMDVTVNPCDNFYNFACGGFMKTKVIPDDKTEVSALAELNVVIQDQLSTVLVKPIDEKEPETFKLAKQLYKVCTDTNTIEVNDLKTAKGIIKKLGGWPVIEGDSWKKDEYDWKKETYKLRGYGFPINNLLKISVEPNAYNSSQRLLGIDQAELPITHSVLKEKFNDNLIKSYYNYLVDFAVIFGADKTAALSEMKEVVEFIFEILKISATPEDRRNMTAMTNIMTVEELIKKYPEVDWIDYLNNVVALPDIKIDEKSIVDLGVPNYINKFVTLLSKTDKRILANYQISLAIGSVSSSLNVAIRNRGNQLTRETMGSATDETRESECISVVTSKLPVAIGALYARSFFKQSSKEKIETLVENLHSRIVKMLKEVDWMDDETRKEALSKASAMKPYVGYPSELLDDKTIDEFYAPLKRSDDFLEFMINIQKFDMDRSYRRLIEKIQRGYWIDNSATHTVNAFYNLGENTIILPAGILQGMMYDAERPEAMNYGAIGFIIGHEITHGFDDRGKQINTECQLQNWWSKETSIEYTNKAECIIKQYSNFSWEKFQLNLNGIVTQGENIADNGGAKIAYQTYKSWSKEHGDDKCLPNLNYNQNQLFWISLANAWCTSTRDAQFKLEILTSDHSPAYFRVLGVVSNSKDFADDFQCPVGSPMNPVKKCTFW